MYDGINGLVRKGIYYVLKRDGKTYNIGIRDSKTIIYRREELDEYDETIDITHNIESNVLNLCVFRQNKNGSTYSNRYYSTRESSFYPDNWIMSYEEAKNTINTVLDELSIVNNINNYFDVEAFRKEVFDIMNGHNKEGLKRDRINQ